ncbi:hypothetical protein [Methylophaga sp. OBS4]|uniref:hypothetical protein n=1 Tax=Methylophaga sp. OBS4 TaxID=2991935 RepID=UPI00225A5158|nr:hypothetical protein [Methylophaga sp. OBS4]MCX4186726.1 hypothetical protein [Methylophaga sp. OBS4]
MKGNDIGTKIDRAVRLAGWGNEDITYIKIEGEPENMSVVLGITDESDRITTISFSEGEPSIKD